MRHYRRKLAVPSEEEIEAAIKEDLEVIAFAPTILGTNLFIKMQSHGGAHLIFYVNPRRADFLRRILQEALPTDDEDASPRKWVDGADPQAYGSVLVGTVG